jgi:hypothetical protein
VFGVGGLAEQVAHAGDRVGVGAQVDGGRVGVGVEQPFGDRRADLGAVGRAGRRIGLATALALAALGAAGVVAAALADSFTLLLAASGVFGAGTPP